MTVGHVIVLGAGQLGTELMRLTWPEGATVRQYSRDVLDITDAEAVREAIVGEDADLVLNAAAYTAVDKAEDEPKAAFAINRDGPGHVAAACALTGAAMVHVSTDYVFDGDKASPYTEDDPVAPLGVYGASKEAGERAVRSRLSRALIVRTAWVFSAHGSNFVKTMIRLAAERDELGVVADQQGCPTAAADLAVAMQHAAMQCLSQPERAAWGTYHFGGAGPTTWHAFAEAVIERQAISTRRRPPVRPLATAEFPTRARRPTNSVLNTDRFEQTFGMKPRPWQVGMDEVLAELGY